MSLRAIAAVLLVCVLCAGCGSRQKRRPDPAPRPQFIGTIALVNEEARFVLIDAGYHATPAGIGMLRSFTGETESATLRPTEVRRRPFVIADIVTGAPQKGDRVFQ